MAPNTQTLEESTQAEWAGMLAADMRVLTLEQVREEAAFLGYRLDTDPRRTLAVGRYVNRGNDRHYQAFGCTFTDTRTGRSFAHVDADRTNLPALQELRFSTACLHRGAIVEL